MSGYCFYALCIYSASSSDPLRFKPNPSNLVSKVEVDSSSDQDEKPSLDPKLYVPPRVVSAPYNENPGQKGRKRRQSALIAELKEEVLDMPSEVKVNVFSIHQYSHVVILNG